MVIKKILYIKYGELYLKKKNRQNFIDDLFKSIKNVLENYNLEIKKEFDNIKIFIDKYSSIEINNIISLLKFIPGIHSIYEAEIIDINFDFLANKILDMLKNKKTFKLECKRKNKNYFLNSQEIIGEIAKRILSVNNKIKVNCSRPDILINFELNENYFILYMNKINGIGGFPISKDRILVLISGGIDSPVASCLLQKKGFKLDFITFISPPYTNEKVIDKIQLLINKISLDGKLYKPNLYVVNCTPILHEINHISKESYKITLLRRSFFRIASEIAKKFKIKAIATGESLGQVASQTIESMETISEPITNMLIYRPLLTYDKQQIITLAKFYETYNISLLPFDDSCTLFAPKHPITKPNIITAKNLENEIDILSIIEERIVDQITKE